MHLHLLDASSMSIAAACEEACRTSQRTRRRTVTLFRGKGMDMALRQNRVTDFKNWM